MTRIQGDANSSSTGFLTEADEMSLAQSRARVSDGSSTDTLEVRGDSLILLQDELESWRRPVQAILAAAAIGIVGLLGATVLSRLGRKTA
jgi:hypothetical protein